MTIEMYKALKSAGVEDKLATAAARGLPDDPATQAQLEAVKRVLERKLTELRAELQTDVAELRTELKTDVERIEKRMTWRMVVICGIFSSLQTSVTVALMQQVFA